MTDTHIYGVKNNLSNILQKQEQVAITFVLIVVK